MLAVLRSSRCVGRLVAAKLLHMQMHYQSLHQPLSVAASTTRHLGRSGGGVAHSGGGGHTRACRWERQQAKIAERQDYSKSKDPQLLRANHGAMLDYQTMPALSLLISSTSNEAHRLGCRRRSSPRLCSMPAPVICKSCRQRLN